MIFDPRKRFNESDYAKQWHDTVASNSFAAAVEAAMLITQTDFRNAPDMGTAAANAWRMDGAQKFLANLMSLTEKAEPKSAPRSIRPLDYKALER